MTMNRKSTFAIAAALCGLFGCRAPEPAAPQESPAAAVKSPDGRNEIRLYEAPLRVEALRDGVTLVAKTRIGLMVDGQHLAAMNRHQSLADRSSKGALATPVYKKASVDLARNETLADFGKWGVALVARDDGVAYRFETKFPGEIRIDLERCELAIPDRDAKCWANYTGTFGSEESITVACTAKDLKTKADDKTGTWEGKKMIYLPLVYRTGGKTVAVTESDVRDYPIWNLKSPDTAEANAKADGPVRLDALFAGWPKKTVRKASWDVKQPNVEKGGRKIVITEHEDYSVKTAGTRTLPWRCFILADEPSKILEADMSVALAAPADPKADFSWVKPGKVAWDWWNCFDNAPANAPNGGCTTKTYERFIDFAAKTGVEYVIFDEGWSEELNIWKFHPCVDVPHLIEYANKKGVGIILWMAWAQVYGDEEKVASHFAKLGAKGFKVDFMDRGDAECARFLEKFAAACAKNRMLVDYHGVYRPTGLHRRYPNILNYEGVHGLEQMKWHDSSYDFMANDVRLSYVRMAAGPMDYTPGAMLNYAKGTYKGGTNRPGSYGTRCRQMAMMALFEAPLQMLCDSPSNYERNRESFRFMAATPTVWTKTVALGGEPDGFIALARQAKDGSWYVAGMTNWDARDFTVDTSFLGGGKWLAEIFRDDRDAGTHATHYVRETVKVGSGEKMPFWMAPGGGFVMRISKR